MVSSTVGSLTMTGWKRRSRAASFSIYWRYSLRVVAPDAVQLTPGQHGLQEVARIHGALGLAGAHDGVQLVNEENDAALGLPHLVEHGLQPLLKLAAVFGPGDEGTHVQGEDGLVLQRAGHVALHDPLGQALGDGRFCPRLAHR